jgi:hypothetical protein
MARAKRRGNHEGSITRRKDGRYMARTTIGRDEDDHGPQCKAGRGDSNLDWCQIGVNPTIKASTHKS